jgi:hypothetical protein
MSEVLLQESELQTAKTQETTTPDFIAKTYTLPQFIALQEEENDEKKFLSIVAQLLRGKIVVTNYKMANDECLESELSFRIVDKIQEIESSYLFRLFERLPVVIRLGDEILGPKNRVKSIELVLTLFKNEKAIQFMNAAGADALDKVVFVSLLHIFLGNSSQRTDLFSIFNNIPKSLYVIYLNRLMHESCVLATQKLIRVHKPDIINDEVYLSITPRLFHLLGNQDIEMI